MQHGNALNWFEIPVTDFNRAKKFYETIFNYEMPESMMGTSRMGFFLYDFKDGKVGGAIVFNPNGFSPARGGCLVYLNCQPDLQIVFDRVVSAGGSVQTPKTLISAEQQLGYWALITDTEGNTVALHSMA